MKTKKITDQMLKVDILFLIGKKEEVLEFFEKEVFGKKKGNLKIRKRCKEFTIEEFKKLIKNSGGFANRVLFDVTTGNSVIVATLFVDAERTIESLRETEDVKVYKKHLKFVFAHELRHAADIIIDSRGLKFEDKELSANLQGWINSEFEDTRDEYFEKELPKIIKEALEN